ncbi:MAG: holin family protein [Acutalibacteraceae bacterium]
MKETICTLIGTIGSGIAAIFGGWDAALLTLIILMAIDYITGLVVAGVFHKSKKSDSGALQSHAGFKGLCKKGAILLIILVAARLDLTIGTTYIRDAVCIAYIANEAISIVENVGLMGVPMPQVILKAIDVLKNKSEKEN